MEKLVVVIMGEKCEKYLRMCVESVKDAEVVFCDGGTEMKEPFFDLSEELGFKADYIQNNFNQEDPNMNGKQRNFYLDHIKKNYPDYWCLVLDADEVVEDLEEIKELINRSPPTIYSIKMRHLYYNLGYEDATRPEHYVPNRLFKVDIADKYPEIEHSVLQAKKGTQISGFNGTTIWHLAFAGAVWDTKKRFDGELQRIKGNMHSEEELRRIYYARFLGHYPVKQVNPLDIPDAILNNFNIDKQDILNEQIKQTEEQLKQLKGKIYK